MPSGEQVGDLPVVVALGSVDPGLVSGVLDGHCRFVAAPGEAELAAAEGAIARADARVDRALLGRAPALRVIARTGVGTDLIDVPAATARGIAVVITPGAGCTWSSGSARSPRSSVRGAGRSVPASVSVTSTAPPWA
jgi:D-3-phosphoglycerate dehydrogenase